MYFKASGEKSNGKHNHPSLIELRHVEKYFKSAAGDYHALKAIDLEIGLGEFVGIIGRSGSGKSTLINMITGIDRPSSGEVLVGDTPIHTLTENQMARWRGRNLGIVFQFFQLLPNLSVVENVMMPMDLCNIHPIWERRKRAMKLLDMVGMKEQAEKLPSTLSGGQQQRVAIARALANDPPLILADEPTGNLDSKTADAMFILFENLAAEGKTVVMVTHDSSLARRVSRTVLIVDGEVVNEYVAQALPSLSPPLMLEATHRVQPMTFQPGATIIKENEPGQNFYIISKGTAEVVLKRPSGEDVVADRLQSGQYFGEVSLLHSSRTIAAVRAISEAPVEVLAMDAECFQNLLEASPDFHSAVHTVADERAARTQAVQGEV